MARRLRWPSLSIRATVLLAIVLGMVLPAVAVVAIDGWLSRAAEKPVAQRARTAVQSLAAAALVEPAWTLNGPAIDAAAQRILAQRSVCSIELIGLPLESGPRHFDNGRCSESAVVVQDMPLEFEGVQVAQLRMGFDAGEIERRLTRRQSVLWWLVAAQVGVGSLVLLGVLSVRLLRPIDRLKAQASALASPDTAPVLDWPRRDELSELGRHLNDVRMRLLALFGELEGKNTELHLRAMFDDLTGLPNRRMFREMFAPQAAAADRSGKTMALFFIDLDRFKDVNDTHGHPAGDELLAVMAQRLSGSLRGTDVVGRLGGDEFVAMLPLVHEPQQVTAAARRLVRAVQAPVALRSGTKVGVSASIGIALYPQDGASFDTLLQHADLAMLRTKQDGRAAFSFYQAERDNQHLERLALERELAHAIDHGELRLYYQPLWHAAEGRIVGCEALVRWQHPRRGLLMPGAFIAVAEQGRLIEGLGAWTLEAACRQLAAWKRAGLPRLTMAVNLSALQLRQPRLADEVVALLQRHGIEAGELELELTESALLPGGEGGDTFAAALKALAPLRAHGVRLALDDFGTGYSSLSYLKRLRPDKLKIDRSFVKDLPGDDDDRALTQAIVALAGALEIRVVAEGVETAAQRDCLMTLGCVHQQGYLHGRPVPPEELEARLCEASAAVSVAGA